MRDAAYPPDEQPWWFYRRFGAPPRLYKPTVTKSADPPITKRQPPRHGNVRGRDMTEVTAMQAKTNDLHVRVSYATDCPEWWRIAVGRRLGRQGPATRAECVAFLRRFGESEDDNLAMEYERWNEAAAKGEQVYP